MIFLLSYVKIVKIMSDLLSEFVKGRKTFFITPDSALFSQTFMEEYLSRDYECYFITNDINVPIQTKVKVILSLFQDPIIFFNVDYNIEGFDWHSFIAEIQASYPSARIGIMYAKRKLPMDKTLIEKEYNLKLGIQAGCIQLDYQKNNNFVIMEKVLFANQANGRRKNVRVVCLNNSSFNLDDGHGHVTTYWLNDISISHFSFTIPEDQPQLDLKEYEKVENLSFVVKGMRFTSDATLFMKRQTASGILYVFAFIDREGKVGLDDMRKKLMLQKMYGMLNDACSTILERTYEKIAEAEMQKAKEAKKNALKKKDIDLPEIPE